MNKLTKKLLTSIITLAFAFIALGTTTFAWFTLSNTVTVAQFEAQVTAGSGFEVSVDGGENYYTNVPTAAINKALRDFYIDKGYITFVDEVEQSNTFRLLDLTSETGTSFSRITALPYENGSETAVGGFTTAVADKGYIELQLKFRSPVDGTKIYIGANTGFEKSEGISWKSDTNYTNAKEKSVTTSSIQTYYAADAARMSFTAGLKTIVYESPESVVEGAGTEESPYTYFGNTVLNETAIENGAVAYFDKKTETKLLNGTAPTLPGSITAGTTSDSTSEDANLLILTLQTVDGTYYSGTVTVRVWIEGWDPDCFNAILDDILKVNLHFITK